MKLFTPLFQRSDAESFLQQHTGQGNCELSIDPNKPGEPLLSASLECNPLAATLYIVPTVVVALALFLFCLGFQHGAWKCGLGRQRKCPRRSGSGPP